MVGVRLPWRTRLRLFLTAQVDRAGVSLCEHGHNRAAQWLWQATGLW